TDAPGGPARRLTKAAPTAPPTPPHPVTQAPVPQPAPVAANEEEPVDIPDASPPPSPAHVHFYCDCGRRLKARQQDAGGAIDCPNCGHTLIIPAENTAEP